MCFEILELAVYRLLYIFLPCSVPEQSNYLKRRPTGYRWPADEFDLFFVIFQYGTKQLF